MHFERRWFVLGPVSAEAATSPALLSRIVAAHPSPGLEVSVPDGPRLRWLPRQSWVDVVDFSVAFGGAASAAPADADRFVFAQAGVHRPHDGPADLLLGSDAAVLVWINGEIVGELPPPIAFVPDQQRIPVKLRAGTNDVLVRLRDGPGPCRLTLRVVETGAAIAPVPEITPVIVDRTAPTLVVRTDAAPVSDRPPVEVTVLAPGGHVVAAASAPRGKAVAFDPTSWSEGPYEIRCVTETAWQQRFVVFLPWFNGDIVAAAHRALTQETSAPGDPGVRRTRELLHDLLRERTTGQRDGSSPRVRASLHSPLMELAELGQDAADSAARIRPSGFVRLAWVDEVDGSPQFCRAYLPPGYDASQRWPVVVNLHGFNPSNPGYTGSWSVDERHHDIAERHGVIVLEPHGRGNTQYTGIGESDVLRGLAEARRQFAVDDDRVYLMGNSMGGSGTWQIASRHPGVFAAIAPIFGGWDLRVAPPAGGPPPPPPARNARDAFRLEQASSFSGAENLRNVPVFVHHGDADAAVSVDNSRHIVRQLQRWGYDVRYRELPGAGHEDLGVDHDIVTWFLQHRRKIAPKSVRIRATDLRGASAGWLQVQAFDEPSRLIVTDAEFMAPGVLRLDTDNVAVVRLTPPAALRGDDDALHIIWNGQPATPSVNSEAIILARDGSGNNGRSKAPGLEGPISDLIRTPFIVVVGTASSDPLMRQRCREKAEAFRTLWSLWQHHDPRIRDDTEITAADEQTYSLLLIGGADANLVARRIKDRLPLAVDERGVTIDGGTWPATDAVVQMIYPSPFRGERYVMVVAATSPDGMYFWNPLLWNLPFGFPTIMWDWTIQDGRRVTLTAEQGPEQGWIAAGLLDASWRRDDRWTVTGDAALRESAPMRHPAPAGFRVSPATLETYAGYYEIAPGYGAVVTRRDEGLEIALMGSAAFPLVAETESEFANPATGGAFVFRLAADGSVEGLTMFNDGRAAMFRKVR